ncbi:MAG: UvrD-helicase domain-containing protein [Muribaculaceae bacterium]|nr:UvrD-helicase domain-containing protein [Muribaculaceae bacterium]
MISQPDYTYLELLNPQQRAAVEYHDGPSLVIAGAGSGKTRVLTYKIVNLLQHGFEPYRIMALTFTNKAAREMKERITGVVGAKTASRLWMGTFHSIFLRILRRHSELIGFKPSFTIYDTNDSRSLIKMIVKDLALDEKIYKPAMVASLISNAKNALISAEQYVSDPDNMANDRRAKRPMIGRIYQLYSQRCKVADAMDFDDILFFMNLLLRNNQDILRHYQDFFKYILVDEYQDTNFAQHLIISQLAGTRKNLCVVGDDAQSIYSFRGANIANILNLDKYYPGLKIFKLERNYRSTQNIINAAGSLIEKNTRQMRKHVYSENELGDPVTVMSTYSDIEEAYLIANMISQSKYTHHDSYDEYAVLYRTNAQSRVLEESLRKRNIPYRIYGGLSFYQRKEIKDAVSYFRMAVNPDDDEALRRIINYPARGIGDTTMKHLQNSAIEYGVSIWQVICHPDKYPSEVRASARRKLDLFKEMIEIFIKDNVGGANAYELGQLIYNRTSILTTLAHDNTPESISKQENLSELLAGLKDFVETRRESGEEDLSMSAFISEVQLSTDQDENDDASQAKVALMTAHAAKGLEFKHIYIVGVEEELFPSAMSMDSMAEVEEERRLLYVALTRAKETCVMTYAGSRFRNGQTVMTRPSRFLSDIDTRFLRMRTSTDLGYEATDRPDFINPRSKYITSDIKTNDKSGGSLFKGVSKTYQSGSNGDSQKTFIARKDSVSRNGKITVSHRPTEAGKELNSIITDAGRVEINTVIEHSKFGIGKVIKLEHVSGNDLMIVDFGVVGVKKLLLRFAKFTIKQ